MSKKIINIILLFLVVCFAFLRLYRLDTRPVSLFSDEVDIGYQVKSLLATGKDYYGNPFPIQFHSFSDVRTALPIYSTALVSLIPGVSIDLAIRLTPAIFSLLGILATYLLVNSLFIAFDISGEDSFPKPGLLAALILSLTPWHFTYSRTAFELSQLYTFICFGLYFFLEYLKSNKTISFVCSLLFLSLIPAVYSTAKLSLLFIPLLLFSIPGFKERVLKRKPLKVFLLILFLPLLIIVLSGGAAQRFSEIAIFTEPTMAPEINLLRQQDLGVDPGLGRSTSFVSKIAHSKPLMVTTAFIKNLFGPISLNYLFVSGDENLRQAVPFWGMLLKSQALLLLVGGFLLIYRKKNPLILFLSFLAILSIAPAALTRDGATHASRNFMLVLPLVIIMTYALYSVWSRRFITSIVFFTLLFESFLYLHDYFIHYPLQSEKAFHAGLKEMVNVARQFPDKTVVLTRTYEPSLIFYLYYADYPPAMAQKLIPQGKITEGIDEGKLNLEGVKVSGTNVYLASVHDYGKADPLVIKDAIYVLPVEYSQGLISGKRAELISQIRFPSGLPYLLVMKPILPVGASK